MEPYLAGVLWIVIVGFVIAFILAFGIGAVSLKFVNGSFLNHHIFITF